MRRTVRRHRCSGVILGTNDQNRAIEAKRGKWHRRLIVVENVEAAAITGPGVIGVDKNTGWIDLLTGITTFQRQDGEYLVFVEEDHKAKVLLYRWRP